MALEKTKRGQVKKRITLRPKNSDTPIGRKNKPSFRDRINAVIEKRGLPDLPPPGKDDEK